MFTFLVGQHAGDDHQLKSLACNNGGNFALICLVWLENSSLQWSWSLNKCNLASRSSCREIVND